jgi:hypothetical protein
VTAASGTLREGLFLASSDHGVGLFADRPFVSTGRVRDVVTGYGGELGMHPHGSINTDSHRRGVGASGSNDGAHWARLIARHQTLDDPTGEQFRLQHVALPVEQRTRLLPMKWVDRRLRELIMTSGVGIAMPPPLSHIAMPPSLSHIAIPPSLAHIAMPPPLSHIAMPTASHLAAAARDAFRSSPRLE